MNKEKIFSLAIIILCISIVLSVEYFFFKKYRIEFFVNNKNLSEAENIIFSRKILQLDQSKNLLYEKKQDQQIKIYILTNNIKEGKKFVKILRQEFIIKDKLIINNFVNSQYISDLIEENLINKKKKTLNYNFNEQDLQQIFIKLRKNLNIDGRIYEPSEIKILINKDNRFLNLTYKLLALIILLILFFSTKNFLKKKK